VPVRPSDGAGFVTAPLGYPPGFIAGLAAIVGEAGLRYGPTLAVIDPGVNPGNLGAGLMVRPTTTEEVARVLMLCNDAAIGVVPQGGRTGLAGGAVSRPGQLILSLERMNRIESVNPDARTATVEAGVTLERLDSALTSHGLAAGIDLGARGSATIGGMVSTNAGGVDAFRYGMMRERVLGLEVVLADGTIREELSRVRKDNAGLPLRQLFIGSEGTLGIVTRVVIALVPAPGPRHTCLVLVSDLAAAVAVMRAVEAMAGTVLEAAELMSGNHVALTARTLGITGVAATEPAAFGLLLAIADREHGSTEGALEAALIEASGAGRVVDALLPKNAAEERDLWRIREDWAVDRILPGGLWYDVSVPVDALASYLAELEARIHRHDATLEVYVVGHLADGNLHITVNAATPITARYEEIAPLVYQDLRAIGGSFSAEHGIGIEKVAALERWTGPAGIALMRAVKLVFDRKGILNPGKVLRGSGTDASGFYVEDASAGNRGSARRAPW
jgi:FAD/FMN-containing dehydrogenase